MESERISDETKEADRRDAATTGHADRQPTPEEERLADEQELDPEVARSYEEAIERGARQEGEGRVDLGDTSSS